ncbi:SelT/SelW/SelH family protein [Corallincola platygyrae]|uniref:SelT/SelW/SelH family protein n=1 Tax=Corallincola platygyrae TaxID=1193278 RepID=A0ABW4XN12_9GAMM
MSEFKVEIRYCPRCRWLMRAGWVAQELLTTFDEELDSVAIGPGDKGQFDIWLNGELIWCRKDKGGFPELKPLKQLIRDRVAPARDLGHSDRP